MYVYPDFQTKKALKEAVSQGKDIQVYQPNNIFNVEPPENGKVFIEGPHGYHKWYAEGQMKDGKLVKVK